MSSRYFRVTCLTTIQSKTLIIQGISCRTVDCSIYTTTAEKWRIRRIHNGIRFNRRNFTNRLVWAKRRGLLLVLPTEIQGISEIHCESSSKTCFLCKNTLWGSTRTISPPKANFAVDGSVGCKRLEIRGVKPEVTSEKRRLNAKFKKTLIVSQGQLWWDKHQKENEGKGGDVYVQNPQVSG